MISVGAIRKRIATESPPKAEMPGIGRAGKTCPAARKGDGVPAGACPMGYDRPLAQAGFVEAAAGLEPAPAD